MRLTVQNNLTTVVVVSQPVGVLNGKQLVNRDVTVATLEKLGPELIALSNAGAVTYSVYTNTTLTPAELEFQFQPVSDTYGQQFVSGTSATLIYGTNFVVPGTDIELELPAPTQTDIGREVTVVRKNGVLDVININTAVAPASTILGATGGTTVPLSTYDAVVLRLTAQSEADTSLTYYWMMIAGVPA